MAVVPATAGRAAEPVTVQTTPIDLDNTDLAQTRAGALTYRGGLELVSPAADFGGLSGLHVTADGAHLRAVSDRGYWFTASLRYDSSSNLSGVADAAMAPLTDGEGRPLTGRGATDAESLSPDGAGGWYVAFEQRHRIVHYPAAGPAVAVMGPEQAQALPGNRGLEGLTRLADGRLLALGEADTGTGFIDAYVQADGGWDALRLHQWQDFRATGATTFPDGSVLVLQRAFSWLGGVSARIVHVPRTDIAAGAVLRPRELARMHLPLNIDNMEGIAARTGPDGETLVYLISDDNFSLLQRTLLLMFEWGAADQ